MIKPEVIGDGILKIVAPQKLQAGDFTALARYVEPLIRENRQIRVVIDASHLEGWKNMAAIEEHAAFVKAHHNKVDHIAIIARKEWQHWLVGALKIFLHPEIRIFDKESDALNWIRTSNRGCG